jgi:uncharacterized protein (DUF1778 family)
VEVEVKAGWGNTMVEPLSKAWRRASNGSFSCCFSAVVDYREHLLSTTGKRSGKVRGTAETRVNLRVTRKLKAMLLEAAKLRSLNLTEFVLESSQAAAEMALADRTHFVLSPQKWRAFHKALDAPPREIPALRKLLSHRSSARWAVDRRYQGQGIGKSLLQDAIRRSLLAADVIGFRALLVHAIDQAAADRYLKYGFKESPPDQLHLMILVKDLRHSLG